LSSKIVLFIRKYLIVLRHSIPLIYLLMIRLLVHILILQLTHSYHFNKNITIRGRYYVHPPFNLHILFKGAIGLWLYGSCIYNYLCNQYLSLKLWVRIPLRRGVLDATLWDNVCQWLAADRWISPGTPVSSTNKTDHYWNIVESGVKHHNHNPPPYIFYKVLIFDLIIIMSCYI
jgi:hypothetical protein